MATCGHKTNFSFLPPSLDKFAKNFPDLLPDLDIDRTILRCRLCDLIDTEAEADRAALKAKRTIVDIEARLAEANQGIVTWEDPADFIPRLLQERSDTLRGMDQKIREVWEKFWAVWGPGEGPNRLGDVYG